ncbi:MAG TPA: response regulator transcription factor [Nitrospira sp.]|jgi:DNA-binding NarL/FixJ family response regulator|nr:response regulator transcription factor [Nitrospira sp.]
MSRPRVLLADDHRLVVEACVSLLEPDCEVVGIVTDGRALVPKAIQLQPDVVVLDIGMPLLNGLDAGRQVKQAMPSVKLIFLTMNEDPDLAAEALALGASGYLLKTSAARELPEAIRTAVRGDTYVTSQASQQMIESFVQGNDRSTNGALTPRQREVLQLLAEGYTMKEAAGVLHVTPRTVAFHKYRVMQQFRLRSNAELIQFAIDQRITIAPSHR